MKLPVKVVDDRTKEIVSLLDADGRLLASDDMGYGDADDIRQIAHALNRTAAADRLAEACDMLLRLSLPRDVSGERNVECDGTKEDAANELVKAHGNIKHILVEQLTEPFAVMEASA